jgi:OPA family glycerol-3-phosphate transporter-like MFS transporter
VRELLRNPRILAHLGGMTFWQVFYWTIQIFGPTILVQSFGLSGSRAATVVAIGWAINLVTLFAAGRLSDRLQLRKPLILAGGLAGLVAIGFFARLVGSGQASATGIVVLNAILGAALALAYAPWMALYSEDVEDIRPELQATAWGLFGLAVRSMIVPLLIIAPVLTAAAGSWRPWLLVALACNAVFIPAVFGFGGTWRRAPAAAAAVGA